MKALTLSILLLATIAAQAVEGVWTTDVPKAVARAKAEKKLVLLDFTGSDWCGWCIKFHKEVFSTGEFVQYAQKGLVLVELDYPNAKPQSDALKKANAALQAKYKVDGFPTLVVLNGDGKEVWRQVGYASGGPKAFLANLEKLKGK